MRRSFAQYVKQMHSLHHLVFMVGRIIRRLNTINPFLANDPHKFSASPQDLKNGLETSSSSTLNNLLVSKLPFHRYVSPQHIFTCYHNLFRVTECQHFAKLINLCQIVNSQIYFLLPNCSWSFAIKISIKIFISNLMRIYWLFWLSILIILILYLNLLCWCCESSCRVSNFSR